MCRITNLTRRDHNATSYSTETLAAAAQARSSGPGRLSRGHLAEIITLRAIALKPGFTTQVASGLARRDHNATSYSTETFCTSCRSEAKTCRDHNATSYSTETKPMPQAWVASGLAEIITLRAIALKQSSCLGQLAEI